jgi:hypothetical protein
MPSVNVLASCRSLRDRSCPSAADRLTVQEARQMRLPSRGCNFASPSATEPGGLISPPNFELAVLPRLGVTHS